MAEIEGQFEYNNIWSSFYKLNDGSSNKMSNSSHSSFHNGQLKCLTFQEYMQGWIRK